MFFWLLTCLVGNINMLRAKFKSECLLCLEWMFGSAKRDKFSIFAEVQTHRLKVNMIKCWLLFDHKDILHFQRWWSCISQVLMYFNLCLIIIHNYIYSFSRCYYGKQLHLSVVIYFKGSVVLPRAAYRVKCLTQGYNGGSRNLNPTIFMPLQMASQVP